MRKSKLVAVVLVSAGLLFGASGTALAAGNDTKPETSPAARETTAPEGEARPTPADTTAAPRKRPAEPSPTAVPKRKTDVPVARPAKPVQGNPSFTG